MSQTKSQHAMRDRLITLACYGVFIAIGIVVTVLGPAKESLTQKFNMPLSDSGIFLSLHFIGAVVGILLGGWMLDRVNARYVLVIGTALVGGGFTMLPSMPTRDTTFLVMLLVGLGYGLLDIGPNIVVASLNRERASIALNLLNIMWGIGAALGPQVANFALNQKDIALAFIIPGLLTLALIPPFLMVSLPHDHAHQHDPEAQKTRSKVRWYVLLPFMLLMLISAQKTVLGVGCLPNCTW